MEGIFKNQNVYIYIDNDKDTITPIENQAAFILAPIRDQARKNLYGGRVKIYYNYSYGRYDSDKLSIFIDGIGIRKVYSSGSFYEYSSPYEVVAYLNQIENLGVDTFLENYKHQLQQLKQEMEKFAEDLQQELAINYDEKKAQELSKYKQFILKLGCVLFALFINMNAGLENQHYISAYENIINSYF